MCRRGGVRLGTSHLASELETRGRVLRNLVMGTCAKSSTWVASSLERPFFEKNDRCHMATVKAHRSRSDEKSWAWCRQLSYRPAYRVVAAAALLFPPPSPINPQHLLEMGQPNSPARAFSLISPPPFSRSLSPRPPPLPVAMARASLTALVLLFLAAAAAAAVSAQESDVPAPAPAPAMIAGAPASASMAFGSLLAFAFLPALMRL